MEKIRILVAEDSEDTGTLIKFALEKAGYEVHHVLDGLEALKAIEIRVPDLLITDILMPGMNGFELMEELGSPRKTSTEIIRFWNEFTKS